MQEATIATGQRVNVRVVMPWQPPTADIFTARNYARPPRFCAILADPGFLLGTGPTKIPYPTQFIEAARATAIECRIYRFPVRTLDDLARLYDNLAANIPWECGATEKTSAALISASYGKGHFTVSTPRAGADFFSFAAHAPSRWYEEGYDNFVRFVQDSDHPRTEDILAAAAGHADQFERGW